MGGHYQIDGGDQILYRPGVLKKKISHFFEPYNNVWAVFLFGSQAKQTTTRNSDVDLAILCDPKNIPDFETQMSLKEDLSSLLGFNVDLIVMNTANQILKHQIYKHGQVILNRNSRFATLFWVRSLVDYCDLKISRAVIEKKILKGRVYG